MAIIRDPTAAAGYPDCAEWGSRGDGRSHDASFRVVNDHLATRIARLDGNEKPRRVLIVDDDPAIRMLHSISLQNEELVVLEAADGRRALEQARSERPDLESLASFVARALASASADEQPTATRCCRAVAANQSPT
jgi:hypothetical protein